MYLSVVSFNGYFVGCEVGMGMFPKSEALALIGSVVVRRVQWD